MAQIAKRRPSAKKTKKSTRAGKPASKKVKTSSRKTRTSAGSQQVTIDRRHKTDRRQEGDTEAPAAKSSPVPKLERRKKVNRRRQIDPTTCERDYTDEEVEFMNALEQYKRTSGRMFPTCSELLEVVRSLGYAKLTPAELAVRDESKAAEELMARAKTADQSDQDDDDYPRQEWDLT